jgi:glycerol uptake facilitator-like aquaporin
LLFLLIASWSAIQHAQFNSGVLTVALAQGVGVWFILLATGLVSADFNPTVTLYEMFLPHWRRKFLVKDNEKDAIILPGGGKQFALKEAGGCRSLFMGLGLALTVIVGSFVGSLAGAAIGGALDDGNNFFRGTPLINTGAGIGAGRALLVETLGSLIWMWAYLVAFQDRYRTYISNPEGFLGFVWTMLVLLGYNYTGASYNWWRHLASAIVGGLFGEPEAENAWIYYVGPILGGLISLIWFFAQRNSRREKKNN